MKLANKYRTLSYALSFMLCISLFASCSSSDDDSDDNPNGNYEIRKSDIVGTWECDEGDVGTNELCFYDDGTGYLEEIGISSSSGKWYFDWAIISNKLYIDGDVVGVKRIGSQLYLIYEGLTFEKFDQVVSSDISSLIKDNVECSASYSDFYTHITINHTLKSILSGAEISCEVGHAEKWSSTCKIINSSHYKIVPTIKTSGNSTKITVSYPFYYYFIMMEMESTFWNDEEYYRNAYTDCELYLTSYDILKTYSSLDSNEKVLFDELKKLLKSYESKVRGFYTVWVYLTVNGERYLLKSYNI